jgi:PAS domain S-box-containing protein
LFDSDDKAVDYVILETNQAHEKMSGMPPAFVGKRVREVMPTIEEGMIERVGRVALSGEPIRFEEYVSALGRWFEIHLSRVGGEGSRTVVSLANNITERKRAEQTLRESEARQAFLLQLSDVLRPLADPVAIQEAASRALGEYLEVDRCAYGEVDAAAEFNTVHRDYRVPGMASFAGTHRMEDFGKSIIDRLRRGEKVVIDDVDFAFGTDAVAKQAFAAADTRAVVGIPLVKAGRLAVLLFVNHRQPRHWIEEDIQTLEAVGERTWAAVERARAEQALRESEEQLRRSRDELEHRVQERTAQIKALFERLVGVQEEERRRIARDIHDQLGQQITALRMTLEATSITDSGPAQQDHLYRSMQLAEELDRSIDFLAWDLRPAALDHLGLPAALQQLVSGWSDRFSIRAEFLAARVDGLRLPPDGEANLYRLTQEALHNIVKHAGATHVTVTLQVCDEQHILLIVEDNGRGFAVDAERQTGAGLGLGTIRERALLLGGVLEIDTALGRGTAILVRIPLEGRMAPSERV